MADLRKAADSLRTMARRYRKPDDMKWRKAIANAVGQTLLERLSVGSPSSGDIEPDHGSRRFRWRSRMGAARIASADHT